jgi:hypothetical protein
MLLSFDNFFKMSVSFLNIPSDVMTLFKRYFVFVDFQLSLLRERMDHIIDGTRKKQLSEWWLKFIETEADEFLKSQGFVVDSLPHNYTDVPPADMDVVCKNHILLKDLMRIDCKETEVFLESVTRKVYDVLDQLIEDTKFTLQYKEQQENQNEIFATRKSTLEKDVNYLMNMKSMDDEIQRRRKSGTLAETCNVEMTDVVPVGGLVMARLHILECELRTAIEIWDSKGRKCSIFDKSQLTEMQVCSEFESFLEDKNKKRKTQFAGSQSEFADFVFATCPFWTPQDCLKVALQTSLHAQQPRTNVTTQRHGIRLGAFRSECLDVNGEE